MLYWLGRWFLNPGVQGSYDDLSPWCLHVICICTWEKSYTFFFVFVFVVVLFLCFLYFLNDLTRKISFCLKMLKKSMRLFRTFHTYQLPNLSWTSLSLFSELSVTEFRTNLWETYGNLWDFCANLWDSRATSGQPRM